MSDLPRGGVGHVAAGLALCLPWRIKIRTPRDSCLQQWAGTKDDEEQERQVAWKRGAAYVECITCKQEFFGETALALGREALLRTTARHQRATAESADSFERTQLDMAESLSNLAQLLQVRGSTT